ncbi:pentapeptide repeat-containing protein [Streptomyces sp. NBC_00483]|uniref:pentapeptide repeat-containing protein n=1 Tax=Streptomyces sp. NBC_00483 TaxID=2975756 RepID=UPI003FCD4C21
MQGRGVAGDGKLGGHHLDRLREHRSGRGVVEVSHGGLDSTSPRACTRRSARNAPGHRAVGGDQGAEHDEVGDAETEPEEGAAAPLGAAPQGDGREDDRDGAEEDVHDEQPDQTEDERGDGHAVDVTPSDGAGLRPRLLGARLCGARFRGTRFRGTRLCGARFCGELHGDTP